MNIDGAQKNFFFNTGNYFMQTTKESLSINKTFQELQMCSKISCCKQRIHLLFGFIISITLIQIPFASYKISAI